MAKRILCLGFIFLLAPALAGAAIYQWTDKQGQVHFSDQPHPGAKKIILPPVPDPAPRPVPVESTPQPPVVSKPKVRQYHTIEIVQPQSEATLRSNEGLVTVYVYTDPALFPGDKYVLLVDGLPSGAPQTSNQFSLQDIYRGTHSIQVEVIDPDGKIIGKSETVIFFMQRNPIRRPQLLFRR